MQTNYAVIPLTFLLSLGATARVVGAAGSGPHHRAVVRPASKQRATMQPAQSNPLYVGNKTVGGVSGTLHYKVTVIGIADDASRPAVTFSLGRLGTGSMLTCDGSRSEVKKSAMTARCSFSGLGAGVYRLLIRLSGAYIGRYQSVLTVADPSWKGGGGRVMHNGVPAEFGFLQSRANFFSGFVYYVQHDSKGDATLECNALFAPGAAAPSPKSSQPYSIASIATVTGEPQQGQYHFTLTATPTTESSPGTLGLQVTDGQFQTIADLSFDSLSLVAGKIVL
jgi:hypothetical protein